jgi:hypothetical protein
MIKRKREAFSIALALHLRQQNQIPFLRVVKPKSVEYLSRLFYVIPAKAGIQS